MVTAKKKTPSLSGSPSQNFELIVHCHFIVPSQISELIVHSHFITPPRHSHHPYHAGFLSDGFLSTNTKGISREIKEPRILTFFRT